VTIPASTSPDGCPPDLLEGSPLPPIAEIADDGPSRALRQAAVTEVAARGYRATTVNDILARTGMARTTFYGRYPNKAACVAAATDEVAVVALALAAREARDEPDPKRRLTLLLGGALGAAAQHPEATRLLILESHAAGAPASDARGRAVGAYARLVREALLPDDRPCRISDDIAHAIAGAVERTIIRRVVLGQASGLPPLAPDLTRWAESYRPLLEDPAGSPMPSDDDPPPRRRRGRAPGTLVSPGPDGRRRLPPGPRRGPRSLVEHSQRDRILDAVATIVATEGYDALTTRALAAHAEISLRTVYERFASTEDAFAATLLTGARGALAAALPESMAPGEYARGLYAGLNALLSFLAEEPAFAKVALVDALSAGAIGHEAQTRALGALAAFLVQGFAEEPACGAPLPLVADAVASGTWEVCAHHIRTGRAGELPSLAPSLAYLALTPLLGAPQAVAVVREAHVRAPGSRPPG